jgi:dolichol-phosphate mannosyltransferase
VTDAVNPQDGPKDGAADGYPGVGRVLVVIPTYNEADNVRIIVDRVRTATPNVDVLVADDGSPDGTGAIADELAAADPQVHVLHRTAKEGLGAAYVAGFSWARDRDYDAVVEMDADGSHQPEQLHLLLDALGESDAVLGSRYVPGGKTVNWPVSRQLISRIGNLYVRIVLGMPVKDATGGYRAYRMPVLDKIEIDKVASQGYCFQVEGSWRSHKSGCRLVEVPITFVERERGQSKMSSKIVREALWRVTVWGAQARVDAVRRLFRKRA